MNKYEFWDKTGEYPKNISKYDVVFLTPINDPTYGIPIGDGDTGCLIHTENSSLVININKTDLWDDLGNGDFRNWKKTEEERSTCLRHGGIIKIDFGVPCFELIYEKDYCGRLSLLDASASVSSKTPFSDVNIKAFASNDASVTVLKCNVNYLEAVSPEIVLERWGSRTFAHWYAQIKRDTDAGLGGTNAYAENGTLIIEQRLSTLSFCVAAKIVSKNSFESSRLHSHSSKITFEKSESVGFCIYISVETGDTAEAARKKAISNIENAVSNGYETLYKQHCKKWQDFWEKSYVSFGNEYLENLWYLNLYYSNSQCRGIYPPHFCNGIWGFNHDFVPWNYYFHYNMQLNTFPLNAANHPELLESYINYRYNQLEKAKAYCERVKGVKGAFYTDVADRNGYNDLATADNCTPGAQLALLMWQYYQYTGDKVFLKEKALKVIKETSDFYANSLKKCSDGYYHLFSTQAYEGSPLLDDSITDLSMIRALFSIMMNFSDDTVYAEMLNKLTPFETAEMDNDEFDGTYITEGLGKGTKASGSRVLYVGKLSGTNKRVRRSYGNNKKDGYEGFPDPEFAPVFPSCVIGLSQENTEIFNALKNQAKLHTAAYLPDKLRIDSDFSGDVKADRNMCMGWCLLPIVLAKLGMKKELEKILKETASTWIFYPQGIGHYGPYRVFAADKNFRWKTNTVKDVDTDETFQFPAWQFRHFDFETLPIIACAINEMLLQSDGEIKRIFPAFEPKGEVRFKLAASGGFVVSVFYENGDMIVKIQCRQSGKCRILNPWQTNKAMLYTFSSGKLICEEVKRIDNDILEFTAVLEHEYVISDKKLEFSDAISENSAEINSCVKHCGLSQIGTDRMF